MEGPDGEFSVRTNELGMRGRLPPDAGPWTLALGCSTTFGWGVEAEQAWPAVLAERLGEPVINGGVPGWSTLQARRALPRLAALGADRVILGFVVRDAQAAPRSDAQARPTPALLDTQIGRLFGLLRVSEGGGDETAREGGTTRVPVPEYAENLRALVAGLAPAEVLLLAFPQPEPATEWVEAMGQVRPALVPTLPRDAFFASDPIHLTIDGNRLLADWIAEQLTGTAARQGANEPAGGNNPGGSGVPRPRSR